MPTGTRAARIGKGQAWWEWLRMTGAGVPGAMALSRLVAAPGGRSAGRGPGPWAGLTSLDLR